MLQNNDCHDDNSNVIIAIITDNNTTKREQVHQSKALIPVINRGIETKSL